MASTLSANVYGELLHDLLAGDPAPGDALPSERTLSERFGVNRHAVREAVKRLQQAGLVHVSQGGATRVLDWREHGGLALMEDLVEVFSEAPEVLLAALEMRACVGADAARRCAERAPADLLADLAAALDGQDQAPRHEGTDGGGPDRVDDLAVDDDGAFGTLVRRIRQEAAAIGADGDAAEWHAARADAYERLWRLIVIGSGNVAYRLALNSLVAGDTGAKLRALTFLEARDVDAQRALVDAIVAGDAERASKTGASLLERTLGLARLADALAVSPDALLASAHPEPAPDG